MVMTETAPVNAVQPKEKLTGRIIKTTLAGAVVDVGQTLPGVLHISQIQKDPVNKVEDILREGQNVEVWVRRVRQDRIELTMIQPLQYEWKDIMPEMVVRGKVVRLETYGAFVEIGAERPGMIHISELSRGYVKDAKDIVKEGDEVEAKVLSVDAKKRQIRLSLKALEPEPPAPQPADPDLKRSKRDRKPKEVEQVAATELEPDIQLTAMQLAWQAANDRAQSKHKVGHGKRRKDADTEQEEILSRTLSKRIPTGT